MAVQVIVHGIRGEKMIIKLCDTVEQFKSITVLQLKEKIPDDSRFPAQQLRLIFINNILDDDSSLLSEYGIQHLSIIHMVVCVPGGGGPEKGDGGMGDKGGTNRIKIVGAAQTKTTEMVVKLFINDGYNAILTIKLCDSEFESYTVLQLKTKIRDIWGWTEDQQRLIYAGIELEDDRTLFECGIRHESIIDLILRPRRGWLGPEEGAGGMGDKGGKNRTSEQQRGRNSQTNSTDMVVRVHIRGLRGKKMTMDLCDTVEQLKSITVLQLKEKIIERVDDFRLPAKNLRLMFEEKLLNDDSSLLSYGIQHMSVINMVVRVPGGRSGPEEGDGGMGDKGGTNRSMEKLSYF